MTVQGVWASRISRPGKRMKWGVQSNGRPTSGYRANNEPEADRSNVRTQGRPWMLHSGNIQAARDFRRASGPRLDARTGPYLMRAVRFPDRPGPGPDPSGVVVGILGSVDVGDG